MEPDPVLVSNTREWLLRAKEDLDNAQHDLMATPPFVRDALFHCQQVVEKAMKALLYVARLSLSEDPQSGGAGRTVHTDRWHARLSSGRRHAFDGVCSEVPISWRALGANLAGSAGIYRPCADIRPHPPHKATTLHYKLRRFFQRLVDKPPARWVTVTRIRFESCRACGPCRSSWATPTRA